MPNTGVALYIKSVVSALLAGGHKVTLVSNKPLVAQVEGCDVRIVPGANRLVWEQVSLRRALGRGNWDVYFAGWNFGLPFAYGGKTHFVLAVLDLIPALYPEVYLREWRARLEYKLSLRIAVRAADKIITISEASARDFEKFFPGRAIQPIHIRLQKPDIPKGRPLADKYFLYLGGVDPRKNIDKLLRAFAQYAKSDERVKLVLLGKGFEQFEALIEELGLAKSLVLPGFVSDDDKFRWLAHSEALVYPSSIEGYGLPVAEAVMCGAPVITGDSDTLREIGGAACMYVDPKSVTAIAKAMQDVRGEDTRGRLAGARDKQIRFYTDAGIDGQIQDVFTAW
jgi:glycosyltransferase involved in cell wall biosynthesis